MRHFRFFIIILLYTNMLSCSFLNPTEDSGEYMEKTIELQPFNAIELNGIFHVVLINNSTHFITFKGGDNVYAAFSYSNNNLILQLEHDYSNWFHNLDIPTIEIYAPEIFSIHTLTSCNISNRGTLKGNKFNILISEETHVAEINLSIDCSELRFHSKGTPGCKITLQGKSDLAEYTLNGSTNIYASELESQNSRIGQNSLSDAHIWATDSLEVTFYNSGNVYYKGNPHIKVNRVQINNQKASGQVLPQ
ncbi:head GIN domain-containing protein [Marinifilum caeruleilacunae]|uniref:DUF2807 domain-containing protein n=1 Tax=Marinifilum caeruleilacunae TaxID=2499076 RepID=A0ABX1WTQ7_9BACT|nr:head GIN domain-containing protein [Marinifilum caeruleilacunae]NOU59489.1 DUF2807 domain-containing protein [Marinifilum caeruleilacunae]